MSSPTELPPGLFLTSVSPFPDQTCVYTGSGIPGRELPGSNYLCDFGDVSPSVVSGLLVLDVNATAPGTVTANFTAATLSTDISGTGDDSRSLEIIITPINADVAVFITDLAPGSSVLAGSPHQLVFTVFNSPLPSRSASTPPSLSGSLPSQIRATVPTRHPS